MQIIPAIDIIDGKCVRLTQGDYSKLKIYDNNPIEVAKKFKRIGTKIIHIIDLDGAKKGYPVNMDIIIDIFNKIKIPMQIGGGIRNFENASKYLNKGIQRIILGTSVIKDLELVKKLITKFGPERIVVSLDIKDEFVQIEGWGEGSNILVKDILKNLESIGVKMLIITDIKKDGMLKGPNFEMIKNFVNHKNFNIIAAGGISCLNDLIELNKIGAYSAITGKAIYENKIDLKEAISKTKYRNNLAKRIIPCLDIKDNRVVKGTNFKDLKDAGDPVELGKLYSDMGADELVFLDISATQEKRKTLSKLASKIAENISIPFTVGGGIKKIEDIKELLNTGADKVSIGSEAINNPNFIKKASEIFGSQCIVISLDAKKNGDIWNLYIKGGNEKTNVNAIEFAKKMEELGAGELLINSLDRDGTKKGFDLDLLNEICNIVNIPVIASSGAGNMKDFLDVFEKTKVQAALGATVFHYSEIKITELKKYLYKNNINIRL